MNRLILLSFFMLVIGAQPAMAESKIWVFGWPEGHFENQDFEPYLDTAKEPHNSQWNSINWKPEDWISQRGGENNMIRSLYFADIIRDQYEDNGVPVLEVGPNFYNLSGFDKRRVTELFDEVYEITLSKENGMYMLYDWDTEEPIGAYTKYGLQLQ
jgi:hypothetical protein